VRRVAAARAKLVPAGPIASAFTLIAKSVRKITHSACAAARGCRQIVASGRQAVQT